MQRTSLSGYWLVVILICAVFAAMMSTADSALLSISSMISKDIYGLAIVLREQATLIHILDRKFDLLVQMVLAFGQFDFVAGGKIAGFHPGLVALIPNLAIAVIGSVALHRRVTPLSERPAIRLY